MRFIAVWIHSMNEKVIKNSSSLFHPIVINIPLSSVDMRSEVLQNLPASRGSVSCFEWILPDLI